MIKLISLVILSYILINSSFAGDEFYDEAKKNNTHQYNLILKKMNEFSKKKLGQQQLREGRLNNDSGNDYFPVLIFVHNSDIDYKQFKNKYGFYAGEELAQANPELFNYIKKEFDLLINGFPEESYINPYFDDQYSWSLSLSVNRDGLDYLNSKEGFTFSAYIVTNKL